MANFVWVGGSGSWNTPTDWSTNGTATLPSMFDTVTINTPGITVSIGAGVAAAAYTLTTLGSELSLDGGTLQTIDTAVFDGLFYESNSGTHASIYTIGGLGATFEQGIDFVSGTIHLDTGANAIITGGGTLAGTITGSGTLLIAGGSTYIQSGFKDAAGDITIDGGKLGFNESFTSTTAFSLLNGVADLFGNTLTLHGQSVLDATLGNGTVMVEGTATLSGPSVNDAILNNGLLMTVSGTLDQDGNVSFGDADAGAKITVTKAGSYLINGNWNIADPTSTGSLVNQGLFAKMAGGRTAYIAPSFTSSGSVDIDIGTVQLDGLVNSLSGVVTGAGTLALGGAETIFGTKLALTMTALAQEAGVLVLNQAIAYAGEWDMTGGTLNLNSSKTTLTLNGHANLDGGLITGYGGEILVAGTAQLGSSQSALSFGGPNKLIVTGTVDQTNNINFGVSSNPAATIDAGAVWSIEGDSAISGFYGLITNNGLLIDPNGSGIAVIEPELVNNGTLTVNNSTLQLLGPDLLGGIISGSGTLDLGGSATLESGIAITVGGLNIDNSEVTLAGAITYGNVFSETGNPALLNLNGQTLTLTGATSLDAGTLGVSGLLTSAGLTTIGNYTVEGTAVLQITGNAEQVGGLSLNGGELVVAPGATYTLDDDVSIGGGGTVSNEGTFVSTGTGAGDEIGAFYVQSGTNSVLSIDNASLTLLDGGSLTGTVAGADGALVLGSGTFALNAGLDLTLNTLEITNITNILLTSGQTYTGYFNDLSAGATIGLNGQTLALNGITQILNTTINGPGTVLLGNVAADTARLANVAVAAGAVLEVTSTAEQFDSLALELGTLVVANHGNYLLHEDSTISGNGTLVINAGGTLATPDNRGAQQPQYTIGTNIVDNGMISAALGTLSIISSVSGTGVLSIGGTGAFLEVSNGGSITATNAINFTAAGGDLVIGDAPTFGAIVDNFTTGDVIELPGFSSTTISASLNGSDYTISDKNGNSLVIDFGTKETSSSLTIGVASDGNVAIFHS